MPNPAQRIALTGASGFLGTHLLHRLLEAELEVLALVGPEDLPPPGAKRLTAETCDLCDPRPVAALFARHRPDVVLHLAGLVDGTPAPELTPRMVTVNTLGTAHVLEAARTAKAQRIIVAGTAEETTTGDVPASPYAASKRAAHDLARLYHHRFALPCVWLQPTMLYGPHQPAEKLMPYLAAQLRAGHPIHLRTPGRVVDLVYVTDAVDAFFRAISAPQAPDHTIPIASGTPLTISALARAVAQSLGVPPPSLATAAPTNGPADLIPDTEPAITWLNWRASTSLADGLHRTLLP